MTKMYKRFMNVPFNQKSFFKVFVLSTFFFFVDLYAETEGQKSFPEDEIVLPDILFNSEGDEVSLKELDDKIIGLYFSASWCGPCRKFSPRLIEFRNKFSDKFEVILIGADGSDKAQLNYMKKYLMPWPAMKNKSIEAKHAGKVVKVEFIPYLVIIDRDGDILTKEGKKDIERLGDGALEYWKNL